MNKSELKDYLTDYLTTGLVAVSGYEIMSLLSSDQRVILGGTLAVMLSPAWIKMARQASIMSSQLATKGKDFINNKIADLAEEQQKAEIKTLLYPFIQCALQDGFFALREDKKWLVREGFGRPRSLTDKEFSDLKFKLAQDGEVLTTLEIGVNNQDASLKAKMTRYHAGKIQGMTAEAPGVVVCQNGKIQRCFFRDGVDVTAILTGQVTRLSEMVPDNHQYQEIYEVAHTRDQEACAVSFAGVDFLYWKTPDSAFFNIISLEEFAKLKEELDETSIPLNQMSFSPLTIGRDTIGIKRTVMGELDGDTTDNPAIIAYISGQGLMAQYWAQGERVENNQYGV